MIVRTLLLFFSPLCVFALTLERVDLREGPVLTCGQGLVNCSIKPGGRFCLRRDEQVRVDRLDVRVVLCRTAEESWSVCLKIELRVTARGRGSGDDDDDDDEASGVSCHKRDQRRMAAAIQVCFSRPPLTDSRLIRFRFLSPELQAQISTAVKIRTSDLGSPAVIYSLNTNSTIRVLVPSRAQLCSRGLDLPFCCDGPKLQVKLNQTSGSVLLALSDAERFRDIHVCQKMEKEGECLPMDWSDTGQELSLPLDSVAPCLCFQIWDKLGSFLRKEYCPFYNMTALSGSSVSVSVGEAPAVGNRAALIWTLAAPCRLQVELHLCWRHWGGCRLLEGPSLTHSPKNHSWVTHLRHWQLQGESVEVERHPSLCVQVKTTGTHSHEELVCPFEGTRNYWTTLLMLCVLLLCVSVLSARVLQGALKCWLFQWLEMNEMNRGQEVLLVCPPDPEQRVTERVCRLASALRAQNFSVSLDLWSRSEISALGPVPWLHSRLDQVRRRSGHAVLVLTRGACQCAEGWRGQQGSDDVRSSIFNACLSAVLTHQRFVLLRFSDSDFQIPEVFWGLPRFALPSQSLGFITELTRRHQERRGPVKVWVRAGALRAASRALSQALCGPSGAVRLL